MSRRCGILFASQRERVVRLPLVLGSSEQDLSWRAVNAERTERSRVEDGFRSWALSAAVLRVFPLEDHAEHGLLTVKGHLVGLDHVRVMDAMRNQTLWLEFAGGHEV